tara:strand:- start:332 stop:571 length:240 start_codon:yes stop_codon:yes gene_type:complete
VVAVVLVRLVMPVLLVVLVVVDLTGLQVGLLVVQEILHQYHPHREILEEMQQGQIEAAAVAVVQAALVKMVLLMEEMVA